MSAIGQGLRDWGGWIFAGITAIWPVSGAIKKSRAKTLVMKIDEQIDAKVTPALERIETKLSEKLDTLDTKLDGVVSDVARLQGITDARAVVPLSDLSEWREPRIPVK